MTHANMVACRCAACVISGSVSHCDAVMLLSCVCVLSSVSCRYLSATRVVPALGDAGAVGCKSLVWLLVGAMRPRGCQGTSSTSTRLASPRSPSPTSCRATTAAPRWVRRHRPLRASPAPAIHLHVPSLSLPRHLHVTPPPPAPMPPPSACLHVISTSPPCHLPSPPFIHLHLSPPVQPSMSPSRHLYVTSSSLSCHLHVTSFYLSPPPCHLHITSMSPPCRLHPPTSPSHLPYGPPCRFHVTSMSPSVRTPMSLHVTSMPPPCHLPPLATMPPPSPCLHVPSMSLPCHPLVASVHLPPPSFVLEYLYVTSVSPPYHLRFTSMSPPRHLPPPISTSLSPPFHLHVTSMSPPSAYLHLPAHVGTPTSPPCHLCVTSMPLPCHLYVTSIHLPPPPFARGGLHALY